MNEIPYGYCHCGCGQKTNIATRTVKKYRAIQGEPRLFLPGHFARTQGKKPILERFWSKVTIPADIDKCWEWMAGQKNFGYGAFKGEGKTVQAHRFSWELANGPITDNSYVLHKCDNPKCVNPSHLYLGTHADNTRDMMDRKRYSRGERHHQSKLNQAMVADIREKAGKGQSFVSLAKEYGISRTTIANAVKRISWKPDCERCNDTGYLHIAGDQTVDCPECNVIEMDVVF